MSNKKKDVKLNCKDCDSCHKSIMWCCHYGMKCEKAIPHCKNVKVRESKWYIK